MKQKFDGKRWAVAIIGIVALMLAIVQLLQVGWTTGVKTPIVGILIKLGLVFIAMSLAWPGLKSTFGRLSNFTIIALLAALVLLIIRPKAAIWAILLILITSVVNFLLKVFIRRLRSKEK
jgi:uncharacterized membrane protein HdeD (DUF308 family)